MIKLSQRWLKKADGEERVLTFNGSFRKITIKSHHNFFCRENLSLLQMLCAAHPYLCFEIVAEFTGPFLCFLRKETEQ